MPTGGRGGGQRQVGEGHSSGDRGGNRAGDHKDKPDPNGPKNGRQSHGADPRRGQPG